MRRSASTSALWAAALVAVAGLGGCMKTATYGTGESPELAIFHEVTGGFGKSAKPQIQYQPRAPLVLPPSGEAAALPPPVQTASAAAPDWPQDPDQTKRTRTPQDDHPLDDVSQEDMQRLKPLAGLMPEQQGKVPDYDHQSPAYDIIGKKGQQETFQAALKESKGISDKRRYLTDPPDEFRQPASTAPTEFKDIKDADEGNFLTRLFTRG